MIDVFADLFIHLTHTLGGSFGLTVIAVSVAVRLAWMPLGVKFAIQARERAKAMTALKPEVDAVREAHTDPLEQMTAIQALYAEHGLTPKLGQFAPMLVQAPLFWSLFATVRRVGASGAFLWIPNLARPDLGIASLATALMGLAVWTSADTPSARVFAGVATVVFFVIASRMAASIGLLMATSAGVGALQAFVVRRRLTA